jgi:hypothetical protein
MNKGTVENYLRNAYCVLLARARQGMVIFVPQGHSADPTRVPQFYDTTFERSGNHRHLEGPVNCRSGNFSIAWRHLVIPNRHDQPNRRSFAHRNAATPETPTL